MRRSNGEAYPAFRWSAPLSVLAVAYNYAFSTSLLIASVLVVFDALADVLSLM
ncbi:uncharacterized protein BDW70DRAFT_144586 [Aspergillus foveolatus]|uniref:uncharacterized protein n=1 Tax=Aspergillus foveolatus TaxID=210207 RepID=UPI003CCD189D